ncbi:MAG: hypothetical protein HQL99_13350 [Magnetococcales bacterium]|nr:hypothetical protein [Magnetococcales bacterium]
MYRKIFVHAAAPDNSPLLDGRIYLRNPSGTRDRITFFRGSLIDTVESLTGNERQYGGGTLDTAVTTDATSITVNVGAAEDRVFRDGDLIGLAEGDHAEFARLLPSRAVTWNGDRATLRLVDGLGGSFLAGITTVSSCLEATIQGGLDSWVSDSLEGVLHPTAIHAEAVGGIDQEWTITFTSPDDFICSGDTVGQIGVGSINSDFSPVNPDFSTPFFTILDSAWDGIWMDGETVRFHSHPAAVAIWERRFIPAGIAILTTRSVCMVVTGRSG